MANYKTNSGATYWFTGLSGAGKSTLSEALKKDIDRMTGDQTKCFILDGDIIRTGLNKGLGFSPEDRTENIRRISEVSKLFNMAGVIVFVAFISPYAKDRDFAKDLHAKAGLPFFECHISASLEVCEKRDIKGLYKKARAGEMPGFTGIGSPYEKPPNCELDIDTGVLTIEQSQAFVLKHMEEQSILVSKSAKRIFNSLILPANEQEAADAAQLPKLDLCEHQVQYLQTISEGWAFPLRGFMNEMQLVESMHMKTVTDHLGHAHLLSVPITQHCTDEQKAVFEKANGVALTCSKISGDKVLAVMNKLSFFANRKEEIATRTFGCFSDKHPCVETMMEQGNWLISSETTRFFHRIVYNDGLDQFRFTPKEINDQIKARDADACFAFQVRNPLHNGHCLMLTSTREDLMKQGYKNPVLLLHPLGGWCKDDDVPLAPRMHQHNALIKDNTLPKEHIILAIWPSPMYYGGPTEVLWHASSRVGCGITHFITGRDPAGVKHPTIPNTDLYDIWHGQKLLVHMKHMLGGVDVLPFKLAAYHKENKKMEFVNSAMSNYDMISGSRMRAMAKAGEALPPGFMSEEGWKVLAAYYKSLQ